MAKLIILRGNSGSGKSTAAKCLRDRLDPGTLLIPQDTVRRDMLKAPDRAGTPALSLLTALLRWGRENCETVILEGILKAEVYSPLFDEARRLYGPDIYAYYYDIPFEETVRRHATRPQAASFGEEDMRAWWIEKDYIGSIPETAITADMGLDETVERILDDLTK